jgi:hypothetical protein
VCQVRAIVLPFCPCLLGPLCPSASELPIHAEGHIEQAAAGRHTWGMECDVRHAPARASWIPPAMPLVSLVCQFVTRSGRLRPTRPVRWLSTRVAEVGQADMPMVERQHAGLRLDAAH